MNSINGAAVVGDWRMQLAVAILVALVSVAVKGFREWLAGIGTVVWSAFRTRYTTKGDLLAKIAEQNSQIAALLHMLQALSAKLEEVHHQVFPNKNGSLYDRIEINHAIALAMTAGGTREGVFAMDSAGNVTYANPCIELWTNKDRRELVGRGLMSTVAVKDVARFRSEFDVSLTHGHDFRGTYDMRFIDRESGEVKHAATDWLIEPVVNDLGNLVAWIGHIRRTHVSGQQPAVRNVAPPMGALAATDPS